MAGSMGEVGAAMIELADLMERNLPPEEFTRLMLRMAELMGGVEVAQGGGRLN